MSDELNNDFDLVLVFPVFRAATAFLPIVKYLSPRYRVGVYFHRADDSGFQERKTGNTDLQFVELCRELGGEVIGEGPVKARLVILSYSNYSKEYLSALRENIVSGRYWIMHGVLSGNFAMEGIEGFPFEKHLIPDMRFYEWRLGESHEEREIEVPPEKRVEIGAPHKKYPIFDDFDIDYLIAVPTLFGMPALEDRLRFVRAVQKFMERLPSGMKIVLKPHNAIEDGSNAPGHPRIFRLLSKPFLKMLHGVIFRIAAVLAPESKQRPNGSCPRWRRLFLEVQIAIHYHVLLERSVLMNEISPYHNLGLEVFLPRVRKGVITGRSATLWHALHNRLPVFNCVDDEKVNFGHLLRDSPPNRIHPKIMAYLDVPYCGGEPIFNEDNFSVVNDSTAERDLIALVEGALGGAASACDGTVRERSGR